jgi:hypothetical protein
LCLVPVWPTCKTAISWSGRSWRSVDACAISCRFHCVCGKCCRGGSLRTLPIFAAAFSRLTSYSIDRCARRGIHCRPPSCAPATYASKRQPRPARDLIARPKLEVTFRMHCSIRPETDRGRGRYQQQSRFNAIL